MPRISESHVLATLIESKDYGSAGIQSDAVTMGKLHSVSVVLTFGTLTGNSTLICYASAARDLTTTAIAFTYRLGAGAYKAALAALADAEHRRDRDRDDRRRDRDRQGALPGAPDPVGALAPCGCARWPARMPARFATTARPPAWPPFGQVRRRSLRPRPNVRRAPRRHPRRRSRVVRALALSRAESRHA